MPFPNGGFSVRLELTCRVLQALSDTLSECATDNENGWIELSALGSSGFSESAIELSSAARGALAEHLAGFGGGIDDHLPQLVREFAEAHRRSGAELRTAVARARLRP